MEEQVNFELCAESTPGRVGWVDDSIVVAVDGGLARRDVGVEIVVMHMVVGKETVAFDMRHRRVVGRCCTMDLGRLAEVHHLDRNMDSDSLESVR